MSLVRLQDIEKSFGTSVVVRQLSLDIREGEFFSLLGPSGCGKTTTLRLIAGFETPDQGKIFFNHEEVTARQPSARNTGMVFQSYALFPHLTVFKNVAFGLQARQTPAAETRARVQEALQLVEMTGMEDRPVTQLSGGQQQRVALARALAIRPAILLLDEPLSNLDAQLRKSTRAELKRLQRQLGITTIYVTHDQEEALALSDRIAVMNQGALQQIGTPREIYAAPHNLFVMNFIGSCNVLRGQISAAGAGQATITGEGWHMPLPAASRSTALARAAVNIAFRPEHVRVMRGGMRANAAPNSIVLEGRWQSAEFAGTHWLIHATVGRTRCSARMIVEEMPDALGADCTTLPPGERVALQIPSEKIMLFDQD